MEVPVEKGKFGAGLYTQKGGGGILPTGRQRIPEGAMKPKERSPTDLRLFWEIFKSFSLEGRRVHEVCYVQYHHHQHQCHHCPRHAALIDLYFTLFHCTLNVISLLFFLFFCGYSAGMGSWSQPTRLTLLCS